MESQILNPLRLMVLGCSVEPGKNSYQTPYLSIHELQQLLILGQSSSIYMPPTPARGYFKSKP